MKAILGNRLCVVVRDDSRGVWLEPVDRADDRFLLYASYGDPELTLDPTDAEVEETKGESS